MVWYGDSTRHLEVRRLEQLRYPNGKSREDILARIESISNKSVRSYLTRKM
jgi:hypothetical protein